MPTKISLALGKREALSRQVAWGCFTTNLTLPGFGTLLAGRVIGYGQVALCLPGFALTLICGVRFIVWYFANSAHLREIQDQPDIYFHTLWGPLRGAVLGILLFLVALLWALMSSLSILAEARAAERKNLVTLPASKPTPPKLSGPNSPRQPPVL